MSDLDPVALTKQALLILEQRMVDDPANLPSGALLRLAETLMKVRLAELAAKPAEGEKEELTPADILSLEGLPWERKRELLNAQRERTQLEMQKLDEALGALDALAQEAARSDLSLRPT